MTIRRKRKNKDNTIIEENARHRPEYNMKIVPQQQGGRPRHIHFERAEEQPEKNTPIVEEQESVIE